MLDGIFARERGDTEALKKIKAGVIMRMIKDGKFDWLRDPEEKRQLETLVRELWTYCTESHYDRLEMTKSSLECHKAKLEFMSLIVDSEEPNPDQITDSRLAILYAKMSEESKSKIRERILSPYAGWCKLFNLNPQDNYGVPAGTNSLLFTTWAQVHTPDTQVPLLTKDASDPLNLTHKVPLCSEYADYYSKVLKLLNNMINDAEKENKKENPNPAQVM